MKDQTLASVDENLIKTGKFLEDISTNRKKLDCLACFFWKVINQCPKPTANSSQVRELVMCKVILSSSCCCQGNIHKVL